MLRRTVVCGWLETWGRRRRRNQKIKSAIASSATMERLTPRAIAVLFEEEEEEGEAEAEVDGEDDAVAEDMACVE